MLLTFSFVLCVVRTKASEVRMNYSTGPACTIVRGATEQNHHPLAREDNKLPIVLTSLSTRFDVRTKESTMALD